MWRASGLLHHGYFPAGPGYPPLFQLGSPGTAIGLGILALAWAERSLALLATAVVYLVVAAVPLNFGWTIAPTTSGQGAPYLIIQGGLLLLAALGIAVAQRIRTR